MLKVIGKENCSACSFAKKKLDEEGIEYEYEDYNDLSNKKQDKYLSMAQEANNLSFPIIIKDGESITINEVV